MTGNSGEEVGKLALKEAGKRAELLTVLDRVIEAAFEKYTCKYTKNPERISWGRLISDCVRSAGRILNDAEIEEIKARVAELERAFAK